MESDEGVKELKKTTTYVKVVKKPQSDGSQLTKKPRTEAEPSGRPRSNIKSKSELDEALKSNKIEVEVDRLLKIAKDIFRRKKRVNKIMLEKIDEVTKETRAILRQFLKEHRYDINSAQDDTQPEEKTHEDTFIIENVGVSDEIEQNPSMIEVDSEKEAEEIDDGKGEVDDKKYEEIVKVEDAEVAEKEKGEEKDDQALVIVVRDTGADKGK
ncbi:uncharacterized protein LOC131857773 [Cryptomeria japonica]|uniref:uncharacterized protein LOC131857773 n=1 Tax=Cryptomeria japonica TaxID=3369 RepID=UPI0027DA9C70|nr:uncharacterized protein LOC131857773 [Cryptomeria japonica]